MVKLKILEDRDKKNIDRIANLQKKNPVDLSTDSFLHILENIKQEPVEYEESNNLNDNAISEKFIAASFAPIESAISENKKTFSVKICNSIGNCLNYAKAIAKEIAVKNVDAVIDLKFNDDNYIIDDSGNIKFHCTITFTKFSLLKCNKLNLGINISNQS